MVDRKLLAAKIAAVRGAVRRVREVLPSTREAFLQDASAQDVVSLNLLRGIQDCIAMASHWLADSGIAVPSTYKDLFRRLADEHVITRDLAERLGLAAGLRNLIAHQYGDLDFDKVFSAASTDVDDLLDFCRALEEKSRG